MSFATYTTVDYENYGDVQGQDHYVTINEIFLVLGFEPFHSMFISLRLVPMTVVSFSKYKRKASKKELLPWLTKDRCNTSVMKVLFCSSVNMFDLRLLLGLGLLKW